MRDGKIEVNPETVTILESLTLDLLIGMYCAPCHNFNSVSIRDEWRQCGLDFVTCAKLFHMFDTARKEFMLSLPDSSFSSPITTSSSMNFIDESQ